MSDNVLTGLTSALIPDRSPTKGLLVWVCAPLSALPAELLRSTGIEGAFYGFSQSWQGSARYFIGIASDNPEQIGFRRWRLASGVSGLMADSVSRFLAVSRYPVFDLDNESA